MHDQQRCNSELIESTSDNTAKDITDIYMHTNEDDSAIMEIIFVQDIDEYLIK